MIRQLAGRCRERAQGKLETAVLKHGDPDVATRDLEAVLEPYGPCAADPSRHDGHPTMSVGSSRATVRKRPLLLPDRSRDDARVGQTADSHIARRHVRALVAIRIGADGREARRR